jgi:solute carrier family 25 2-oxodicarboxylate transporter 21
MQVKTRMQLQVGKAVPGAEHYDGMVDCFRKIIAKEGCVPVHALECEAS